MSQLKKVFNNLPFKKAVFLGPIAYLVHQIEESVLGFPVWRERNLNLSQNLPILLFFSILMGVYFFIILIHYFWSNNATGWVLLNAILAMQFHNGIYHLVGTIYFAEYSPGLVTGLILYIPLSCLLFYKAYKEQLINKLSGVLIVIISGISFWTFEFFGNVIIIIVFGISIVLIIVYRFKEIPKKSTNSVNT
jgi:hypothetical protein